jgi:hypothetical protein
LNSRIRSVGATRVGADLAAIRGGDVPADLAETHLLLDLDQHVGEALYRGGIGIEQVEGDALG